MTASRPASAPASSAQRSIRGLRLTAVTVNTLSAIQVHHGQGTAPHATGIQPDITLASGLAFQGRPVAKNHPDVVPAGVGKPGCVARRRIFGRLFGGQLKAPIRGNKTHTGKVVSNHPPALHPHEGITPALWLVAIHSPEVLTRLLATDDRLNLPGMGHRLLNAPDMRQAGVHHEQITGSVVQTQVLLPQPPDELVPVREI